MTGDSIEFTLKDWVTLGKFIHYTLILAGDSCLAKTPVAMSMCARIAECLQTDE